ncbi:MAG: quinol:cytochrome C oxidoreductase [Ignavibacteriae bacterium]|nr:MAG: quinol:cytochrome C oxidoreductase [Ignavibacteriota bacterium]
MFMISIGVGALALVALEYLVGATWSTPFRRIDEFLAAIIMLLVLMVIPLFFGIHDLYHWSHNEIVSGDAILQSKSPYLNMNFFTIRTIFCLVVWLFFFFMMIRNSEKQDLTGDPRLTKRNNIFGTAFAPLFVITLTITAIDWMMSLEPHWFSTMYGIYYFSGTMVAAFSVTTLFAVRLKEGHYLDPKINNEHYYSLGAMMFAFNTFWGYIAFSQYLLIWYADLPEENFWLLMRWEGSWKFVSIALIFIHFVIPFLVLVGRSQKTNPRILKIMAIWLLFAHALDLYWLIMPTYNNAGAPLGWQELAFPFLVTGITMVVFNLRASKRNLVPVRDPKLESGLNFHL